jgi:hypothetical protein
MDVDRPAGKKREGMMMTGPTPMQPPAPKPRPPPVVTDMVPKALPTAQSFDISTPPPQRHRPPPAGLNVAPPLPAVPLPSSSTDPQPLQVFSQSTDPPPAPPTFAPAPRKRAPAKAGPPKKRGRPSKEDLIMRDETLTADQKLDKLLELQKGKKRSRSTPTQRPYDEENPAPAPGPAPAQEEDRLVLREKAPKKPIAKAKAPPAIKNPSRRLEPARTPRCWPLRVQSNQRLYRLLPNLVRRKGRNQRFVFCR